MINAITQPYEAVYRRTHQPLHELHDGELFSDGVR